MKSQTKVTLSYQVNFQIGYLQTKVDKIKADLVKDFTYQFAYVSEELFKLQYVLDVYLTISNEILEVAKKDSVEVAEKEVINYWLDYFTDYVSKSYNVRVSSSGSLHREVSTWKFICAMELIKELKKLTEVN